MARILHIFLSKPFSVENGNINPTAHEEVAMIQGGLFDELIFDEHADESLLRQIYGVTPVQIRMMKMGLRFGYVSREDVMTYLTLPKKGFGRRLFEDRAPSC